MEGRPAVLVATCDQWVRATHDGTAVEGAHGELVLHWAPAPLVPAPDGRPCPARGLATDRLCRIYALTATTVARQVVGPTATGLDYARLPDPVVIVGGPDAPLPDADLTGLVVDGDDHLFLADRARGQITVHDLWSRRLLRVVPTTTPSRRARVPVGLAVGPGHDGGPGRSVVVAVRAPAGLLRLSTARGPTELPLPAGWALLPAGAEPSRVAVLDDGTPAVLAHLADGSGWLVAGERPPLAVGGVSDLAVDAEGAVVLAPCPRPDGGATLARLTPTDAGTGWVRAHPLDASGYDGGGIVRTTEGRIAYSTADGLRLAVIGRVTYVPEGRCVTYRLDAGTPGATWGRVLLEACVPDQTAISVGAITTDDVFETEQVHVPADPATCTPVALTDVPPLPPVVATPDDGDGATHRRGAPVTPWWRHEGRYQTWEAPVAAPPGRYLWLTVRLTGNGARTPRVREVRVETQAHALVRRLPAVFAADPVRANFLHRYLAPLDGLLHDLDLRSRCRDLLVDPASTPAEALEWLASFVGLVLDRRWAEEARRRLVSEIVPLFRLRGTVWALRRYLEIYLAGDRAMDPTHRYWVSPVIIEHFRLRGVGGPVVGADPTTSTRAVVGHGFRVGGAVGDEAGTLVDHATGEPESFASAFDTAAHRFTVLVPRPLGAEEEAAVRRVLDTERPAHTSYELCTVDAGIRVGRGTHVGISSIVGPTGAFEAAVTDATLLGRGSILGGPRTGVAVEAARLDTTARVG